MTKVYISPQAGQAKDDNGVGRVVLAQHKYLPACGIELVDDVGAADIVAAHITRGALPRVDVLHSHGLYWTGDVDSGAYANWHHNANALILAAAREARAVTVPSEWVAMPFKRDMRITPAVIGHGIEADEWRPRTNQGYVLWNKNRPGDACSPLPAWELAARGADVVSTFGPHDKALPASMRVIGTQSHRTMKEWIQAAGVYLATTKETFGIGTLEAMASGVPILGYAWGGTLDIVEHGVTGWLVEPGDVDGLMAGLGAIRAERARYSNAAREAAQRHAWQAVMQQYAALYHRIAEEKRREKRGVSIVITNYNYAAYVGDAIESCLAQRVAPDEIIVVDDGSTDNSREVIERYAGRVTALYGTNQGVAHARNAGIEAATQPFIVCLDADDMLDPRYVKTLLPVMQKDRSLGIAYTGLGMLWEDGRETKAEWPPEFSWETQAQPTNPPSNCIPCAAMFRRDMWQRAGGYQQQWAPGEDAEFWLRGLSLGYGAKRVTEEPLFRYRLHGGSASRTKTYKALDRNHPWLNDKQYPMAAPAKKPPLVRSYDAPAVSVIIPVGPNHEQLLPDALDSLLSQTCRGWEAIVINDTGRDISKTLAPYPFVTLISTKGKEGAGKARNLGLEAARAPLVLFLDADDWLLPTALDKMLRAHTESGHYVYTGWATVKANGDIEPSTAPAYSQEAWLYRGQHAVTALVPLEWCKAVGGFDEQVVGWEDWDFFCKLAINGYCGEAIEEPLLVYRLNTGQRRIDSFDHKEELLTLLRERYHDYGTGVKEMAGCCGDSPAGKTILAARHTLRGVTAMADEAPPTEGKLDGVPVTSDKVRMEFIGTREGAVTYAGNSGRAYRAGRNMSHRFIDVHKDDVSKLEGLGLFRVVRRPIPAKAEEVKAEPAPLTQEDKASAIMEAKAQAQREFNIMMAKEMMAPTEKARAEMERLGLVGSDEANPPTPVKERKPRTPKVAKAKNA